MKKFYHLLFTALCLALHVTVFAQCETTNVTANNGKSIVYVCSQDDQPDIVNLENTNTSNSEYAYAVTDSDFNILSIVTGNSFDFDPAPVGNCFVWGFSFTGNILAQPGQLVFDAPFSDGCWTISQDAVSVIRDQPEGGTVSTLEGETQVFECLKTGIPNFVSFTKTGNSNIQYAFIVTDANDNILGLPQDNMVDFSGAGTGVCRVWGVSYAGNIVAEPGDNLMTINVSDDCFDLSDNFISVDRSKMDGGMISTASGDDNVTFCTLDGTPDIVELTNTSSTSAEYAYAITDVNNNILNITTDSSVDFDNVPGGTCRIWGFSYSGEITGTTGESVFDTELSSGCSEVSSNHITVNRTEVNGGEVRILVGGDIRYVCPGDGKNDPSYFFNNSEADADYRYIITDEDGVILGIPPGNFADFEGAGFGNCRVYGLSHTGNIIASPGDDIFSTTLTDDCFDLSDNFISVIRALPEGGTVQTIDGQDFVRTCAGDGIADIVEFENSSSSPVGYTYLVTDADGIILGVPSGNFADFDGAGSGACRVYGLSYTGLLLAKAGRPITAYNLASTCFEVSSNFITIDRTGVDGGTITTIDGESIIYTCPGDGVADLVEFEVMSDAINSTLQIVVTDADNNILGLPPTNTVDFEGAGEGACLVYSLSYTGDLLLNQGDNILEVTSFSTGCAHLSEEFVTVNRDETNGGIVLTDDGQDQVTIVAGDGVADVITFMSSGASNSQFTYVITDDENNILVHQVINN